MPQLRRSLLTTIVICTLAASAQAQTQRPRDLAGASLEELMSLVITTASRLPEGLASAPARVQVVTAAQIERRGYRSVLDVLKDLADFKVDLGGDPDYPAQLTVQGTPGASRVLLLLDGILVSSPTNEPLPFTANYPVHNARQVEIVYGPASALYGADAFSAVINIISKDADEASGLVASSSVGQFGLTNQTASYGVRLGPKTTLMLSGQFLYDRQPDLSRFYPGDFGGLEAQHTGVFNTIFGPMVSNRPVSPEYAAPQSAHSLQARLQSGGFDVTLFQNRARQPTSTPNLPDNAVYNADAFTGNDLFVASGRYTRRVGHLTSTSSLMLSRHEMDPETGYWNVFSNLEKSYKYAYGAMLKGEQQVTWKPARTFSLTGGGSVEHNRAIPQGADLNAPVRSRDQPGTILDTDIVDDFVRLSYRNVGAYAQAQYAPTPALAFTVGARGDANSRYGRTFNPRIGLVATPIAGTTIKVMAGTAFLAPSPYQAY
ncbi:MAG: TonB-dependent receptor, partial [Vicinamibacterales bacterium]